MNILLDAKGTYLARQCAIAFQHLESGMLTETDQKFLNGSESDGCLNTSFPFLSVHSIEAISVGAGR